MQWKCNNNNNYILEIINNLNEKYGIKDVNPRALTEMECLQLMTKLCMTPNKINTLSSLLRENIWCTFISIKRKNEKSYVNGLIIICYD